MQSCDGTSCSDTYDRKLGETELALVMYIKPGCPYCQQARDHYNSKGIPFIEYDAQNDRARRAEMFSYSDGDPTVPCIVEDGNYLGSGWGTPPRG
jgi:glutaredoxin